jgi:alpha-tubulin suppressor-like RCC1 family protein
MRGRYLLSAPERLTQAEQVAAIGQAIGRNLTCEEYPRQAALRALTAPQTPPDQRRPIKRRRSGVHFTLVNSGGSTEYAITRSGDLYAWGNNRKDQIGNGVSGGRKPQYDRPLNDHLTLTQVSSTAADVAAFARG